MKLPPRPRKGPDTLAGPLAQPNEIGPIELVSIEQFLNYKNNPRKHPEKQLVKLMASITEFGVAMPVLIGPDNVIIAGEAVAEAAMAPRQQRGRVAAGSVPHRSGSWRHEAVNRAGSRVPAASRRSYS